MAVWTGNEFDNYVDWRFQGPEGSETAHAFYGLGGNDTIYGAIAMENIIDGGSGHDLLYGGQLSDIILAGSGNDELFGYSGNDLLYGDTGNDLLFGGHGNDWLRGGAGNDYYGINLGDSGNALINEDLGPGATGGFGGGVDDRVYVLDANAADLLFFANGDDLLITDTFDMADSSFDDGFTIEDFFLGGDFVVERAYGADNSYYDLTQFLSPSLSSLEGNPQMQELSANPEFEFA